MASFKERVTARIEDVRQRRPLVDHVVRMQEHYGAVKASQQAGAVTYFAFLSFFPILALAFFVVGWLSRIYADARQTMTDVINSVMPGLVGSADGQIRIDQIEQAASTLGLVGAIVLLYSGLGWLSAMRRALVVVFEKADVERLSFVVGKLRDLITLLVIGAILFVAVAVAGLVGGFSQDLLDWLDIGPDLGWLVKLISVGFGFAANMLLFFTMFVLLGRPHIPRRSLWAGAVLGAVAFEVLKQLSGLLFRSTQGNPAFQAFGIALIVLIWINYFSRVVLYSAAFAHTTREARAARPAPESLVEGPPSPPVWQRPTEDEGPAWVPAYLAGAVSTLGVVALMKKLTRGRS
ncbi:MAG: YihY/virulence factor BrkB family protein [Nocardioides sp.]